MGHQELKCRRCGQPIIKHAADYDIFEGMHWLCFHLEYEHQSDPDVACDDPSCPWWHIDVYRNKLQQLGISPESVLEEAIASRWLNQEDNGAMKPPEIPTQLNKAIALSREAVYFWFNDLEKANLMNLLSLDIKCIENAINTEIIPCDIKDKAEACYRAVSKSSLPDGSSQRSAARSVAHCLFAVWFWQQRKNDKAIEAIRYCKSNAKRALKMHT